MFQFGHSHLFRIYAIGFLPSIARTEINWGSSWNRVGYTRRIWSSIPLLCKEGRGEVESHGAGPSAFLRVSVISWTTLPHLRLPLQMGGIGSLNRLKELEGCSASFTHSESPPLVAKMPWTIQYLPRIYPHDSTKSHYLFGFHDGSLFNTHFFVCYSQEWRSFLRSSSLPCTNTCSMFLESEIFSHGLPLTMIMSADKPVCSEPNSFSFLRILAARPPNDYVNGKLSQRESTIHFQLKRSPLHHTFRSIAILP